MDGIGVADRLQGYGPARSLRIKLETLEDGDRWRALRALTLIISLLRWCMFHVHFEAGQVCT